MKLKSISFKVLLYLVGPAVIIAGILSLTGRNINLPNLQGVFLPVVPIRTAAALAIILSGVALLLTISTGRITINFIRSICSINSLLGIISIWEHYFLWQSRQKQFIVCSYDTSTITNNSTIYNITENKSSGIELKGLNAKLKEREKYLA